jgi:hypothetical protein
MVAAMAYSTEQDSGEPAAKRSTTDPVTAVLSPVPAAVSAVATAAYAACRYAPIFFLKLIPILFFSSVLEIE